MKYSVIIPAKNEQQNIDRLLLSLSHLDYPRDQFEILVIDNGSSDHTVAIASEYGCRVFEMPELTISGVRNYGVSQSRGVIMVFIDADCSVAADWLTAADRWYWQDEVVCFGSPPGVPDNATWVQKSWQQIRIKRTGIYDSAWLESMNMFVRKSTFQAVGGFNETLQTCEDYDLSKRLLEQGRIVSDSSISAIHHGEASTVLHFFKKEKWRGLSNWQGIASHGIRFEELPSLVLPLYFCVLWLLFAVCLLFSTLWSLLWLPITLTLGPAVIYAFKRVYVKADLLAVAQLAFLLNVYFCARGLSFFHFNKRVTR